MPGLPKDLKTIVEEQLGQDPGQRVEPPLNHINVPPQIFHPKFAAPKPAPFRGPPALKGVPPFWSSPQGPSRYEWVAYQQLVNQGMNPQEAAGLMQSGGDLPLKSPISHVAKQYPAFNKDANGNWIENRGLRPSQLPPHITGR